MANTIEQATVAPLVKYDVNEAALAKTREECATLTCDTPQGYEAVRVAIGHLRTTRVAIEKRRVELKADALAFGRLVDSEAKRFTAMITEIESPLAAKKAAVDDEKERIKREAEAEKIRALEAEIAANRARQEAEAKALRDAEEARLATEREALRIERERLAAEQAKLDAARKAEEDVPQVWNVGDVILDLYEVTGILGEGGMGQVWLATRADGLCQLRFTNGFQLLDSRLEAARGKLPGRPINQVNVPIFDGPDGDHPLARLHGPLQQLFDHAHRTFASDMIHVHRSISRSLIKLKTTHTSIIPGRTSSP